MKIHGISLAIAQALVEQFGGEETDMTVEFMESGRAGPGFYAWCTEYPEDGSNFLGPASEASYLPRATSKQSGGDAAREDATPKDSPPPRKRFRWDGTDSIFEGVAVSWFEKATGKPMVVL